MLVQQCPPSWKFRTTISTLVALGRSDIFNAGDHENRWYALWDHLLNDLADGFSENDDPDAGVLFCTTVQFAVWWLENIHRPAPSAGLNNEAEATTFAYRSLRLDFDALPVTPSRPQRRSLAPTASTRNVEAQISPDRNLVGVP